MDLLAEEIETFHLGTPSSCRANLITLVTL